jgi:hypothetical protein
MPYEDPTCGEGLRCVGARRDPTTQELTDIGRCTQSCTADQCCPQGWGCSAVTPFLALCAEGVSDDDGFECMGTRPEIERPSTDQEGGTSGPRGINQDTESAANSNPADDTGCITQRTSTHSRNHWPLVCVLVALMLLFKAKLKRHSYSKSDVNQSEDS